MNSTTHADLTDGSDLDFAYDAAGRRLEKKYTKVINNVTYETKYTYHYIGSQITTIDISGKEDETITKNDQMRIHLGANSRPISFEYYTDIGTEQQASETYYYHYDLHGNVIRVTDDAGTTEITYTYDALGTIVSETNANSIYNPFTWSGEAQIIHDPEFNTSASSPITGLYNSGSGYYNPETGTFLSGTGMPASTNPTSGTMEEPTAQDNSVTYKTAVMVSAATAFCGFSSTLTVASSNDVKSEPEPSTNPPVIGIIGAPLILVPILLEPQKVTTDNKRGMGHDCWVTGSWRHVTGGINGNSGWVWVEDDPMPYNPDSPFPELDGAYAAYLKNHGKFAGTGNRSNAYKDIPEEVKKQMRKDYRENSTKNMTDPEIDKYFEENLEWAIWGESDHDFTVTPNDSSGRKMSFKAGKYLAGYQTKGSDPRCFWGVGTGTITHAGGKFRALYGKSTITDYGTQGPASAWWGSWSGNLGTENVTMHGVSNGCMTIGIFGLENIAKRPMPGVNQYWSQVFDLLLLSINANGDVSAKSYVFTRTCVVAPNGPVNWYVHDDRGLGSYCNPDLYYFLFYPNDDYLKVGLLNSNVNFYKFAGDPVYNSFRGLIP